MLIILKYWHNLYAMSAYTPKDADVTLPWAIVKGQLGS
jgi:hypothetical protein